MGIAAIAVNGNFDQDTTFRRFDANIPMSWVPPIFVNYHADKTSSPMASAFTFRMAHDPVAR